MNQEKKLIAIFRSFIEKALIPQIKRNQGNLHDWNRFNSLLSADNLNVNQLQVYVESLSSHPVTGLSSERKELSLTGRKREDSANYVERNQEPFSANKTFGGERSKHIITGLRNVDTEPNKFESRGDFRQVPHPKDYSQGKEYSSRDDSFRRGNVPSSMQAIGNSPQSPYQPVNIISSLDRLLKQMMQNQQRIDLIEGKSF